VSASFATVIGNWAVSPTTDIAGRREYVVGLLVKLARPSGRSVVVLLICLVDLLACLLRNSDFKAEMTRQIKVVLFSDLAKSELEISSLHVHFLLMKHCFSLVPFAYTEVACMLSLVGLFKVGYYYYIVELLLEG
jgi:hypothetical protein